MQSLQVRGIDKLFFPRCNILETYKYKILEDTVRDISITIVAITFLFPDNGK